MGTALRPDDLMMTHGRRPRRPPLTMWQLSFSGVTEQEGLHLRSSPPASILQEALRRVEGWMEPVPMMVSERARGGAGGISHQVNRIY